MQARVDPTPYFTDIPQGSQFCAVSPVQSVGLTSMLCTSRGATRPKDLALLCLSSSPPPYPGYIQFVRVRDVCNKPSSDLPHMPTTTACAMVSVKQNSKVIKTCAIRPRRLHSRDCHGDMDSSGDV